MQMLFRIIGFTIITLVNYHNPGVLASRYTFRYRLEVFSINERQLRIAYQLFFWGIGSVLVGVVLFRFPEGSIADRMYAIGRGIGLQCMIWGTIDLVVALWGALKVRRRRTDPPDEYREVRETLRLRRILVINARLDLVYIVIGLGLIGVFHDQHFILGNGIGVLAQGFFLLVLDARHAHRLPSSPPAWYDPAV